MKTTIELPDDLVRMLKVRAVHEERTLKDLITEILQDGVDAGHEEPQARRARFPLLPESKLAQPGRYLTPGRVHELLMEDEVRHAIE